MDEPPDSGTICRNCFAAIPPRGRVCPQCGASFDFAPPAVRTKRFGHPVATLGGVAAAVLTFGSVGFAFTSYVLVSVLGGLLFVVLFVGSLIVLATNRTPSAERAFAFAFILSVVVAVGLATLAVAGFFVVCFLLLSGASQHH